MGLNICLPHQTSNLKHQSFYDFCLENQGYVGIGAAEFGFAFGLARKLAAIAQDIDIRKGTVQGHGTDFSPVRIVIKGLPDVMAAMAAHSPQFSSNRELDSWSFSS